MKLLKAMSVEWKAGQGQGTKIDTWNCPWLEGWGRRQSDMASGPVSLAIAVSIRAEWRRPDQTIAAQSRTCQVVVHMDRHC